MELQLILAIVFLTYYTVLATVATLAYAYEKSKTFRLCQLKRQQPIRSGENPEQIGP